MSVSGMPRQNTSHVFIPNNLPSTMSTRAFQGTASDLFDLVKGIKIVPHATVHMCTMQFSLSLCMVIIVGSRCVARRCSRVGACGKPTDEGVFPLVRR